MSRRSTEINHVSFTNVGEDVFYGGEQDVFISVEMGLYPFPLHNSPKSFSDVEVWGIGREIEYVETPVLPSLKAVLYLAALVYGGVVENHNGLFRDSEGEVFHEFDKLVGVYVFGGREAVVSIVAVYHSEDVEPAALVNRHTEILIFEFPCIRHISFGAYMTFISVIQINESRFPLTFKLLQEFLLISVLLRRGCPFGRFSYTSKSCAIKDKKFLKAPSLICFPVASSQAALALETLWRCFRMASLTASLSFLVLIMRFRPFPGLFLSPAIPSDWNLLTQCITRWYVCPARAPAAALLSPSALPNTIRHRIRNEWVEPFRYPFSRAVRCSSLIFIFVACLDIIGEISICKTITFENGFHCINSLIKHTYARDGIVHFYNPDTECKYSREIVYAMPNVNGKFALVHGKLCGEKWHIVNLMLRETSSTDEIAEILVNAGSQQTIIECAPAYFRFVRDLRKEIPNVRAMHEVADVDRRIAATSDFVKNHLLFNDTKLTEDVEYSQFMTNLFDYNRATGESIEASAVLSGFIQFVVKFSFDNSSTSIA